VSLPVLIISGTIGAGKSTIGLAVQELLEDLELPHAFLDLDRLTDTYPKAGRFNDEVMYKALAALWPVYRSLGAERLVLSRVVEDLSELGDYEAALGGCSVTVVLLRASEDRRLKRIAARAFGDSLRWHLSRSAELDQVLSDSHAYDFEVDNDERDPSDTAREILEKVGWIATEKGAV
jgi:chloramphenicol 3-O-phosphotransferase